MSLRLRQETGASRSEVFAGRGMAATSQPLATQAAISLLREGGSAVDAAIGANAVQAVTEPTGAGVGGDLFAQVWCPDDRRLHGLNASGAAPQAAGRSWFESSNHPHVPDTGGLSVTVPGAVDGWFELHQRFGRLPMRRILQHAVDYARDGFPVSEIIAAEWAFEARRLGEQPGFAETFLPAGRAPRKGERFRNPGLARTLESLANDGRQAFYQGPAARAMAEAVQAAGGLLAEQDLAGHHSEWVTPVSAEYKGKRVWQLPPNGQGLAVLQMLQLLEPWDLSRYGFGSPEHLHLLVEAKKLAFADRARYYADPAASDVPVEALLARQYANERRTRIDPERAAGDAPAGDPALDRGDTVYLATADADGMMVSLIQSNFVGMGSGVVPRGLGFSLQNRAAGFSLQPGHANVIAPGKRPFHTIIPGFVTRDDEPWLAFGVMGGAMQPQGQVQVLVNLLEFGMNLQAAGDAPRFRHEGGAAPDGRGDDGSGGTLHLEPGFAPETVNALGARGHQVREATTGFGGYQAIAFNPVDHIWRGASESRKDGQAAGY